jgi:voltage-gated potassium channel
MNIYEKINEIVEPRRENYISRAYDYLMLIAILIGIFPLMFRTQHKIFWYFDIISGICYTIDYILRWMTYHVRSSKSKLVSFAIYPFTPMAIIDLLSILPTVSLLAPTFKMFRVPRLLKVVRVIKIIRYYEPLGVILSVIRKQKKILLTVLSLAFFYIFITAMIMFNAEEDINPQTGEYLFENFFDAFYWAACTLTTVGYGDLYPISDTGRFISIISAMVGIAIIALPSGIITAGYMEELESRRKEKEAKEAAKKKETNNTEKGKSDSPKSE